MSSRAENQMTFPSLLFDTMFGLILYFNIDAFLEIKDPVHFAFYISSLIITLDVWMLVKSATDVFDRDLTNSTVNILFGIILIILVEHITLMSKEFNYIMATVFLLALIFVDLVWCILWRLFGEWSTKSWKRIKRMERELNICMVINACVLVAFSLLLFAGQFISPLLYTILYIMMYLMNVYFCHKNNIITLKFF